MSKSETLVICQFGLQDAVQTEFENPYTLSILYGAWGYPGLFGTSAIEELERTLELLDLPEIVIIGSGVQTDLPRSEILGAPLHHVEVTNEAEGLFTEVGIDTLGLSVEKTMVERIRDMRPDSSLRVFNPSNSNVLNVSIKEKNEVNLGLTCIDHRMDTSMFDVVGRFPGGFSDGQVPWIVGFLKSLEAQKITISLTGHTDCACEKHHLSKDQRNIGHYQDLMEALIRDYLKRVENPPEVEMVKTVREV